MTDPFRRTAIVRLTLATAAWGFSFPAAKAAMDAQKALMPGCADWFHAAFLLMNRMFFAALFMLLLLRGRMRGLTRNEIVQGAELGLFGGLGMLLQTDAQNEIAASTSAFFTQFTVVFVPLAVALRTRRAPGPAIWLAAAMVMIGCVILNGVSLDAIALGRGEWKTILSAVLFTGQILCLERPAFRGNDMRRTATVMFAVKGALFLPFVVAGGNGTILSAYSSPPLWAMLAGLTLFCTVYAYATMTRWQPHVTSTQAGLIYATEPIFATLWALFLPGWLSVFAGIAYHNETLTVPFFVGAALILAANVLLVLRPPK